MNSETLQDPETYTGHHDTADLKFVNLRQPTDREKLGFRYKF